jgi:hypothetical protein
MGRVWMARDELLHRDVAIKELVPPPGLTDEERQEMRERTMREARAIARLSHPNVVRIFDILRTDGDPWIVMEYVKSRSLQDVLVQDGPLPARRAAEIGLGMLAALRAAHRAGVVHRDIKPGNVLLGEDGRVVLTDFGLATIPGDPVVTRTGLVLGSPAYISPERAADGTAGPEADLWSLGATLFAAVEGKSPYARPSAIATLTALATEPPPPARRAGPLKPVLNGLLRKDPAERIAAAEAERLLLRAAGRRQRPAGALLPSLRRPGGGGRLSALRPAPVVAGVASVPPPRTAEPPVELPVDPPVEPPVDPPVEPPPAEPLADRPADEPEASVEAPPAEPEAPPGRGPSAEPEASPTTGTAAATGAATETETATDQPGDVATGTDGPADGSAEEPAAAGAFAVGRAEVAAPPDRTPDGPAQPVDAPTRVEPAVPGAAVPVHRRLLDRARALPPRTLALVAAGVVALVVLLAAVLSDPDSPPAQRNPSGAAPTASAGAGQPTAPAATTAPVATEPAAPPPPAEASAPPAEQPLDLPAGWHIYKDRTGFSVAVPRAWRVERDGTIVYFREQTGDRRVLGIDQTDRPKPDPVRDWRQQEAQRSHTKPNYQRVRIEAVDYFRSAADWEYTYNGRSGRLHAINRGFITAPDQAHAILWITPDRTWEVNRDEFDLIARSFEPIR